MPKAKAKMSERALKARDAKGDLGAELLESVREIKAGQGWPRPSYSRVRHR
jgi:hypothetical protein